MFEERIRASAPTADCYGATMNRSISTPILATVWAALFLSFLAGVIFRPSIETVMASGAATLVLLKIAYDYLYVSENPDDVIDMFE